MQTFPTYTLFKYREKDKGYKIVSAGNVHLEPMAVYSKNIKA